MAEDEENIMKIFVATDVHLGYNEKDPIRGDDSFIAFEEILRHAQSHKVDFVLLGGDLFHETRPSTTCLHRCMTLLRRYCMGDRPVQMEFLSDQALNFQHLTNPQVNYEDPNLNISIPVFSIHGNHDDPTGAARLSALDLLADIGLVNYFGKWTDLTQVEIHPLLMRKGETKLALYGLSHIKDERLSRLFADSQVKMPRVSGEYFNLLVLHQNRADRGPKNYIPEDVLPSFLDLVIWGHEHDCKITPEESKNGVYITQPGSSVATSLAQGESLTKYAGLLLIKKQQYKLEKVLLKTVRPFVFKDTEYAGPDHGTECVKENVMSMLEEMIQDAENQVHLDEIKQPKLPLIRLVVHFTNEAQQFNAIRLGQQYAGRVANTDDMIVLKLKKARHTTGEGGALPDDITDLAEGKFSEQVEGLIQMYFENENKNKMTVLSVKAMSEAAARFLDKNDDGAFDEVLDYQVEKTKNRLLDMEFDLDNIDGVLEQLRLERIQHGPDEATEIAKLFDNPNRIVRRVVYEEDDDHIEINDDDDPSSANGTTTSRSSLIDTSKRPIRGKGSRGPRKPRGKGRAS